MHKSRLRNIDLVRILRHIAELPINRKPLNRVHIAYIVLWTEPHMGLTRLRTQMGHTQMRILQRWVHETRSIYGRPHIGIIERDLNLRIVVHAKLGSKFRGVFLH